MKTEAKYLATLIELGLSPVADAIRWADGVVVANHGPAVATLCDIARIGPSAYPQAVVHLLRSFPGKPDLTQVASAVFLRAKDLLHETADNSRAAVYALRELAIEDLLPLGSVYNDVWWFDDALDLSEAKTIPDTQEQLAAKMIGLLDARIG